MAGTLQKSEYIFRQVHQSMKKNGSRINARRNIHLLKKAVRLGSIEAIYVLGNWHIHGKGVRKNYKLGAKYFKVAAKAGWREAQHDLAVSYEIGKGIKQSNSKAFYWYLKAAQKGDVAAQNELGRCYLHGIGTRKNLSAALKWYKKAAFRGHGEAEVSVKVMLKNARLIKIYKNADQIWIGLIEVAPKSNDGFLGKNAKGAYVQAIGWVYNLVDYKKFVKKAVMRWNLTVNQVAEAELFKDRYISSIPPGNFMSLFKKARKNRGIYFGTFFTYGKK